MGNKLTTGATKVPSQTKAKSTSAAQQLIDEQAAQATSALSDDALEAELRAAQETAMKIASGVDLLDQELKLEAQLAALDDEGIDDDAGGAGGTEGEEAGDDADGDLEGLDEEELAQLQDELRVSWGTGAAGDFRHAAREQQAARSSGTWGGGVQAALWAPVCGPTRGYGVWWPREPAAAPWPADAGFATYTH